MFNQQQVFPDKCGDHFSHKMKTQALYQEHSGWLNSWLCRTLRCPDNASDLAQDTFVRILSLDSDSAKNSVVNKHTSTPSELSTTKPLNTSAKDIFSLKEPRAWLLTIAKRLLIDKSRRYKLEQAYLAELTLSVESNDLQFSAPSAEQLLIALQTLELITQTLETLADKPKKAFLLRHIDGLTHVDIAKKLNVSPPMVRKYLVQSLVACHAIFEQAAS